MPSAETVISCSSASLQQHMIEVLNACKCCGTYPTSRHNNSLMICQLFNTWLQGEGSRLHGNQTKCLTWAYKEVQSLHMQLEGSFGNLICPDFA